METFEARLAQATKSTTPEILGAAVFVIDNKGDTLYSHCSGRQYFGHDAPPVNEETTVTLAAAGKFLTHIAVLQLVEQGLISMDGPVYGLLPEVENLEIISQAPEGSSSKFTLKSATQTMTVRHMILHSSGIPGSDHPLINAWRDAVPQTFPDDTHYIIKKFSAPLLFEPGQGWDYGHSVHFLQVVIERASGEKFVEYIKKHIFRPLGMTLSAYLPNLRPDVPDRLLQAAKREQDGSLTPLPEGTLAGLACSVSDVGKLFADLISSESKVLGKDSIDELFRPAFAPSSNAFRDLQNDTECYIAPIGCSADNPPPRVNYSCGGLIVEGESTASFMPPGTLTWNGMPNVVWAIHRDMGLAMLFATQLIPEDDEKALALTRDFFNGAWSTFGHKRPQGSSSV